MNRKVITNFNRLGGIGCAGFGDYDYSGDDFSSNWSDAFSGDEFQSGDFSDVWNDAFTGGDLFDFSDVGSDAFEFESDYFNGDLAADLFTDFDYGDFGGDDLSDFSFDFGYGDESESDGSEPVIKYLTDETEPVVLTTESIDIKDLNLPDTSSDYWKDLAFPDFGNINELFGKFESAFDKAASGQKPSKPPSGGGGGSGGSKGGSSPKPQSQPKPQSPDFAKMLKSALEQFKRTKQQPANPNKGVLMRDGTVHFKRPDGTTLVKYPDGRSVLKQIEPNKPVFFSNGQAVVNNGNGTFTRADIDGYSQTFDYQGSGMSGVALAVAAALGIGLVVLVRKSK